MNTPKKAANPEALDSEAIEKLIRKSSDFSLEMRTLNCLRQLNYIVQHGGSYDDPITGKMREFDLRAKGEVHKNFEIHLALECKNLSDHIVGHCLKRSVQDAYSDILSSWLDASEIQEFVKNGTVTTALEMSKTQIVRLTNHEFWKVGGSVAKHLEKVSSHAANRPNGEGESFFQTLSQSLSSLEGVIESSLNDLNRSSVRLIVPITVVPDRHLWARTYNDDGSMEVPAQSVTYLSYFVDKSYKVGLVSTMKITHMEIVTEGYLPQLIKKLEEFFD